MEFPEGMPEELKTLLKHITGHNDENKRCMKGRCSCQQVMVLKPEDKLFLKTCCAKSDERKRKVDKFKAESEALMAKNKKQWSDFWERVYSTYGLSSDPEYHWTDDGRIMRRPDHAEED